MKESGIARRVDQLGRIVLPMEIRKKLKLVEGALVNIILEDGRVCLEKYSPLQDFKFYIEDILKDFDICTYFVCDDSKIIFANKSFKSIIGQKICDDDLKDVKSFQIFEKELKITDEIVSNFDFHYIFALNKDGDNFGHIVFAFSGKPNDETVGMCKFIKNYIASKI